MKGTPAGRAAKLLAVAAATLALCGPALALPPYLNVAQLYHTQWTPREGAPSDVESLTQTKDGYLWMGNPTGLFRFDGVRFERVDSVGGRNLLSGNIFSVWASTDGGLWVGHRFGGATFIKDGRLTNYGEPEGLPRTSLLGFAQDGAGTVWAATLVGLFRLSGDRWISSHREWNLPEGPVRRLQLDGQGTLWIIVGDDVLSLWKGASRFQPSGIRVPAGFNYANFTMSSDGVVWLTYMQAGKTYVLHAPVDGRKIAVHIGSVANDAAYGPDNIIDRDGFFWFHTEEGIRRVQLGDRTSRELRWEEPRLGKVVALTGANSFGMLEDQEGNIWVSTSGGLDRFRAPALAKVDVLDGWSLPMVPTNGGGILVGAIGKKLFRLLPDSMPEAVPAPPVTEANNLFSAIYRDPHGELWIGSHGQSRSALWHLHKDRWHSSRPPEADRIAASDGIVQMMAMDSTGAMWISIAREGVYQVVGDKWTPFGGYADLPRQPAIVITADDQQRVWFGYVDNRVVVLNNERLTTYSKEQGLEVGVVEAISAREGNVWIGGEDGLAWFDGHRFHSVQRVGGKALPGISGIVQMPDGDLWLGTAEGAMHIDAADIRAVRSNSNYLVRPMVLSYLDGMPGTPHAIRPLPSAIQSSDGRVWFTTNSGVVWTDPKLQSRNTVVPTVLVNSIDADGMHLASFRDEPLRLQPRMQNLQISYTALSLTMPERVHFKYRLEGQDSAWQDAGTRREAFYTDLKPGHYRFQVAASNNDGVWNEKGAAIEFIIPPTFTQTYWFTALWVLATLGLMLLVFAWWLRQAQAQLRSRLNERLVERERIARDLHDTFLQAVQGLMLRFQTATERIPPQEPARTFMEDALDRADRVLADGRDKIMNLRSSAALDADLAEDLRITGEERARDGKVAFAFSVAEAPRALHPIVREEAYRIGTEALANAFQHAGASRISARIQYKRRELIVQVEDDGIGFDASADRGSTGHWGLKGMRERAAKIRGRLTINSRAGAGTVVELTVPGDIAYTRGNRTRRAGMRIFWRGPGADEET